VLQVVPSPVAWRSIHRTNQKWEASLCLPLWNAPKTSTWKMNIINIMLKPYVKNLIYPRASKHHAVWV
jgi:hypothetical protein